MRLDKGFYRAKLSLVHAVIVRQLDSRLKPIFGFTVRALHVDMHARFFTREEIEPETTFTKNGRANRGPFYRYAYSRAPNVQVNRRPAGRREALPTGRPR